MLLGKRKKQSTDIPTGALPDIVFLLLIFFLVTTAIDAEKGLDLVLPPETEDFIKIPPKNIKNLLINAAGQVAINGIPIEIRDITGKIKDALQENPKIIVSIKADRLTRYDVYVDVFGQIKEGRCKKNINS